MLKRRGIWRAYARAEREQAIIDALEVLKESPPSNCIFAVVVRPGVTNESPIEYAFMQLASRFDRYLGRLRRTRGAQKGMMLFDKSVHEQTIQSLTALYQEHGYQWGQIRNFAEVPAFIDSRVSRLIQLADLVAYSIYRKFQHEDERFFRIIESRFDGEGEKTHGLHLKLE